MNNRFELPEINQTRIKFEKLCLYANELGIFVHFGPTITIFDMDLPRDSPTIFVIDSEDGRDIMQFPPSMEYKLLCKKPE